MSKKVSYLGVFAALALIMGYIDFLIPIPVPLPGIKLGLANIAVVMALYIWDLKTAFSISLIRILLSAFLFSGTFGIIYSLAGCLFSLMAMYYVKGMKIFSVVGVSIIGSIFHNLGQVILASIIVQNNKLMIYILYLLIPSLCTGMLIGYVSRYSINRISDFLDKSGR